ncbi:MAG: FeoB-associated Cys-rich membrane protein [Lentimicrobiaceae bacterium]|nr:FeoB-associated Cys-rich membrane protein [Lentimicrobiaceae bacterium]
MIQEIIVYTIIVMAALYAVCSVVKKIKKGNKKSCGDCSCCVKNCRRDIEGRQLFYD